MTRALFVPFVFVATVVSAWTTSNGNSQRSSIVLSAVKTALFSTEATSLSQLKAQILQLGAAMDRGQSYNPTSGDYYKESMETAKEKILSLLERYPKPGTSLKQIEGEWELVLTTVPHGIFRSSPFFLAVQEAFSYAQDKGTRSYFVVICDICMCVRNRILLFLVLTIVGFAYKRGFWSGQGDAVFQVA
jgi:hypothetical protein